MRRLFAVLLVLFSLCLLTWAQLPTATLTGLVTDPQGAVVTGAKVTVTNQATGISRQQPTGGDGTYLFTNMVPGYYSVRVEGAGFAAKEFKDVKLEVGHAETLNAPLAIAQAGQVITVTGGEAMVELSQSEVQGQIQRYDRAEHPAERAQLPRAGLLAARQPPRAEL